MKRWFLFRLLLAFSAGFVGCSEDDNNEQNGITGSQIVINSFTVPQVSRGQRNAEASIIGANFSNVTSVSLGDGITVQSIDLRSATEIGVVFSVDANAASGPRTISVNGATSSATMLNVLSNRAPVARFVADPPAGSTSTAITFDASGSSDANENISGYLWNFGNAGTDRGRKVTKRFNSTGNYMVTLTVTDQTGATGEIEREIEISRNSPPVARFSVSPSGGTTDTNFQFDGSSSNDPDGRIVSYSWRFDDGGTGQGPRVSHTFRNQGTFGVNLIVTDNKGMDAFAERNVEVEKTQGNRCSPRNDHQGPAHVFDVISADRGSRTIIARFRHNAGCQPFTRCGDVRLGGYPGVSPGKEHWIGVMCQFTDLGNGTAAIRVDGGNFWPSAGQRNLYAWPQECNIPGICRN